jgi:hypothetical protein
MTWMNQSINQPCVVNLVFLIICSNSVALSLQLFVFAAT